MRLDVAHLGPHVAAYQHVAHLGQHVAHLGPHVAAGLYKLDCIAWTGQV